MDVQAYWNIISQHVIQQNHKRIKFDPTVTLLHSTITSVLVWYLLFFNYFSYYGQILKPPLQQPVSRGADVRRQQWHRLWGIGQGTSAVWSSYHIGKKEPTRGRNQTPDSHVMLARSLEPQWPLVTASRLARLISCRFGGGQRVTVTLLASLIHNWVIWVQGEAQTQSNGSIHYSQVDSNQKAAFDLHAIYNVTKWPDNPYKVSLLWHSHWPSYRQGLQLFMISFIDCLFVVWAGAAIAYTGPLQWIRRLRWSVGRSISGSNPRSR